MRVDSTTTVWWRRTGWPEVDELPEDEAELARAEADALFLGMLLAQQPRWVDDPFAVELAEVKLHQLSVARRLGLAVPESLVTNVASYAEEAGARGQQLIAKPVSSGPGLAPYAELVGEELLTLVETAPTFLQAAIDAVADLRVVTVADRVFVWRRAREPTGMVDWRRVDPEGAGFALEAEHPVSDSALALAPSMHLSFSVQDWLETSGGNVFLEVNPQGEWLFLADAEHAVVPALARHLVGYRD